MSTEHTTDPSAPSTTDSPASAPDCSCWSRRESLMVAGVAVAGTAGLTACGSEAGDTVASAAGSAASGAASAASGAIAQADIPVGGGKVFDALKVVITQPTAGDFKAFSAVCTHQGCLVESSSDGEIPCPCHLSHFSLEDGSPISGPASAPLAPVEITVDGDSITQA